MARILIVGGGCRGLDLVRELLGQGHVVRVSTRDPGRRSAIERAGAECWVGTPARLGTLTGALEAVTVVCWLLARVEGDLEEAGALQGPRLESFLAESVDTTVRGFVYEASPGALPAEILRSGRESVERIASGSAIPWALIKTPLEERETWLSGAVASIERLLS